MSLPNMKQAIVKIGFTRHVHAIHTREYVAGPPRCGDHMSQVHSMLQKQKAQKLQQAGLSIPV